MIVKLDERWMLGTKPEIDPEIIKGRGWVAGGSIRRWFVGEKQGSDIDVFPINDDAGEELHADLSKLARPVKSAHAINYGRIQLICFNFESVEDLLGWFDYHHCQFAWDGENIYATPEAIISSLRRHLSVNRIHKEYAVDSLRRAFKYQRQGYTPCWGTLQDIALALRQLDESEIREQVEVSPGGGKRVVRFD